MGRGVYGLQIGFKHCLPFNKIWPNNVIFELGNVLSQRLGTAVGWTRAAFHSHWPGQALPAGHCGAYAAV